MSSEDENTQTTQPESKPTAEEEKSTPLTVQSSVTMTSAREIPGLQPEQPPEKHEPEPDPYGQMLKREYDHAVDQEIRRGIQKISDRYSRLVSQENTPTEVAKDALGNTSDYYQRLMNAYHSGNSQSIAGTTEGLYQLLYEMDFTEMRKLQAIKQEYNQL